jgi:hypothetical protein
VFIGRQRELAALREELTANRERKWNRERVGEGVLDTLIERASATRYGQENEQRHFVLYSRMGFRTRREINAPSGLSLCPPASLRKRARADGRVFLHTPAALVAVPVRRSRRKKSVLPQTITPKHGMSQFR